MVAALCGAPRWALVRMVRVGGPVSDMALQLFGTGGNFWVLGCAVDLGFREDMSAS